MSIKSWSFVYILQGKLVSGIKPNSLLFYNTVRLKWMMHIIWVKATPSQTYFDLRMLFIVQKRMPNCLFVKKCVDIIYIYKLRAPPNLTEVTANSNEKTYLYPCKKQVYKVCSVTSIICCLTIDLPFSFLLLNELSCNLLHRTPDARNNLVDPGCHFRYSPFIDMKHISQSCFPEQWLLPLQLPYVRYNPQVFVFPEARCSKDYAVVFL